MALETNVSLSSSVVSQVTSSPAEHDATLLISQLDTFRIGSERSIEERRSQEQQPGIKHTSREPASVTYHHSGTGTATSPATARVFAIPELLEQILLQTDFCTKGRFRISHVASIMQLCRLDRVNSTFLATLRTAPKLKCYKNSLRLHEHRAEHAAVIWLLRELGHLGFKSADCEAFGCIRTYTQQQTYDKHVCNGAGIQVDSSPERLVKFAHRPQFIEAAGRMLPSPSGWIPADRSWRSLKIAKPLTIYYKSRQPELCCIVADEDTVGALWDRRASFL